MNIFDIMEIIKYLWNNCKYKTSLCLLFVISLLKELDLLLAQADKAEADALAAKKKGNETLEEAQAILKTLESKLSLQFKIQNYLCLARVSWGIL